MINKTFLEKNCVDLDGVRMFSKMALLYPKIRAQIKQIIRFKFD
jgi:hypothetical protein